MTLLFICLRKRERRMYMPRTYIGYLKDWQRSPETPTGFTNWVTSMYKIPDTYVLKHHSMDAYLLLRFLKLSALITLIGCFITWPILFPINATSHFGNQQFDILNISNLAPQDYARYFAHCFVSWIFIGMFSTLLLTRTRKLTTQAFFLP